MSLDQNAAVQKMSREKKAHLKSREENKEKQMTGWSLSRANCPPEPSIDNYIVNIDGTTKTAKHQQKEGDQNKK